MGIGTLKLSDSCFYCGFLPRGWDSFPDFEANFAGNRSVCNLTGDLKCSIPLGSLCLETATSIDSPFLCRTGLTFSGMSLCTSFQVMELSSLYVRRITRDDIFLESSTGHAAVLPLLQEQVGCFAVKNQIRPTQSDILFVTAWTPSSDMGGKNWHVVVCNSRAESPFSFFFFSCLTLSSPWGTPLFYGFCLSLQSVDRF